ncbi:MAG: hypothetical protein PHR24_05960 [Oscillospiraceae bacterium]|nr:hypothetical protein [Oscillospiraceae bacterium]MDD3832998.1 hypothetical protein [Oscillospiraceae bacterium]MDD4546824.1 hypothetical protein [Oscillospiraceae bacterium]
MSIVLFYSAFLICCENEESRLTPTDYNNAVWRKTDLKDVLVFT